MGAVQRAVFRLHEPQKLDKFLRDLGHRHNKNGAKLEYIDVSRPPALFLLITRVKISRRTLASPPSANVTRRTPHFLRYSLHLRRNRELRFHGKNTRSVKCCRD